MKVVIDRCNSHIPCPNVQWWVWGYTRNLPADSIVPDDMQIVRTGISGTFPGEPRPDQDRELAGGLRTNLTPTRRKATFRKGMSYRPIGPMAKIVAGPFASFEEAEEAQQKWIEGQS